MARDRAGLGKTEEEAIKAWYDRTQVAAFRDEPLYVTPEEYDDIKRRFSAPEWPDAGYGPRSTSPHFLGAPVVVDAEKATERAGRRRLRSVGRRGRT